MNILKFFELTFVLVFTLKMLEALFLFHHGDALNYHLVGPRLILETSFLEMMNDLDQFYLAGIFDYFYILPNWLFGTQYKTQIMGQFMHVFGSLGISAFLIYRYFNKSLYGILAGLSILTLSYSADFFLYAKNDGVLATLVFINFLYYQKKEANPFIMGLLLGLMPLTKMSGLIYSLIIGLLYIFKERRNISHILKAAFTALLVFSPIVIRNYYFLDSPFYPGLLGLFPGKLSPAMLEALTGYTQSPLTLEKFPLQLKAMYFGKILFLISPLLFLANIKYKKSGNFSFILFNIFFVLYLLTNGGNIAARFIFPSYFLCVFFIFNSLKQYPLPPYGKWVLLVLILVDSKIDRSINRIGKSKIYFTKTHQEIINQRIPITQLWNHISSNPEEKIYIISDELAQMYYSPSGVRVEQFETQRSANFFYKCEKEDDVLKLKKYSYAILGKKRDNPCQNEILSTGKLLTKVLHYSLYELRQ